MPSIVAKITYEDGTESSFGPLEVPESTANNVVDLLAGYEESRLEQVESDRVAEIEAEQERRNVEIEEANERRAVRGQRGLDPDGDDELEEGERV